MAFVMLIGSFSVMGNAYQAYKGDEIAGIYNDVDSPAFSLEQYASMGLDEVDRMLAKEQMVLDLLGLLTLDITSIDACLASVASFLETGKPLIALLGDAATLDTLCNPIKTVRRSNSEDTAVIYALLDFVANLREIARNYVIKEIDVGILQGFISDYVFDVRELAIGLVYGMTEAGKAADFDYMDQGGAAIPTQYKNDTTGAITLLQQLLNEVVLGEWKLLDDELNDPASKVNYYSYAFQSEYDETYFDTDEYDYYGWVHPNDWVTVGLGGCERVPDGTTTVPPAEYSVIDITTDTTGYDFIESLMRQAYDYVLVPVLNRDTRPWMRKLCGITYNDDLYKPTKYVGLTNSDGSPMLDEAGNQIFEWQNNPNYDPTYDGDEPETWTIYKQLFNVDGVVPRVTDEIPENTTLVDYFNNILGEFITVFLTNDTEVNGVMCSWSWDYTAGNKALFDNIVSVGKYVICVTGDLFFSDRAEIPSPEEIMGDGTTENPGYDGQKVLALIMREILNNSVDYLYIDDSYVTIVDVAYRAVEQLAWQDIPQFTYVKPVFGQEGYETEEKYYSAVVDKMLDILFDIAVYNLNQGFDMNLDVDGKNPLTDTGLLQYQGNDGSYETNLVKIAAWAVSTYADILALDLNCDNFDGKVGTLTADDVWMDFDTIINSLIPIKGSGAWIADEIAGDGTTIVSKAFVFDYILKPIYSLDATNFATIFKRNTNGAFATKNGVQIIVDILDNVFDLLFPEVFQPQDTVDQVLQNSLLGDMVYDLIGSIGYSSFTNSKGQEMNGRGGNIAATALPVVCMILGLSDDQEFEQMEIYLPENIKAGSSSVSFDIYNGSSGINTGYTDVNGKFTQDKLYTYVIDTINTYTYDSTGNDTAALTPAGIDKGTTISGGDSINVTLNGTFNNDVLLKFVVTYDVLGETGEAITKSPLSTTVYSYISTVSEDDDAIEETIVIDEDREIRYEKAIYLDGGDDLDDFDSYMIRVADIDKEATVTATVDSITNDSEKPFAIKNTDPDAITQSMNGTGGIYFLTPFEINTYTETDETTGETVIKEYERVEDIYEVDENGDIVYDEETEEPVVIGQTDGVPNGLYNLSTNLNVNGKVTNVKTLLNLYDDYGLESAFERAVLANRQKANYDTDALEGAVAGYWNNYVSTLEEVARFVLKPKSAANFQTTIAATAEEKEAGYENKYEVLADKLEAAIELIEEYALNSGAEAIKTVIDKYSAINYDIVQGADGPYKVELEYYDDAYEYFGMRDYVPHTYNRYKDALRRAESLVKSQELFVPAPFEDDYEPTDSEVEAYQNAVAAYKEAVENMAVVSSIDSLYAQHMLNLTGGRLIKLEADTSKLADVITNFSGKVPASDEGLYTTASLEAYRNAEAFAAKTVAKEDVAPSQVNKATTELVYTWKHLTKGADYTKLDAAIVEAEKITTLNGFDAAAQTKYTEDSYQAFLDAYNTAKEIDRDLGDTDKDNQYIEEVTAKLISAMDPTNLIDKSTLEAVFEITTEDPGLYWNVDMSATHAPYLDVDSAFVNDILLTPDEEGTIDAFLVLGLDIWDDSAILAAFGTLENARVEVIPNANGGYGTGTVARIYNATTDELCATYCVVVHGDVNEDGAIDVQDVDPIAFHEAYMEDLTYSYKWGAADINLDYSIDVMDSSLIADAEAGILYDMVTGQPV